jgi:hexosaminidase
MAADVGLDLAVGWTGVAQAPAGSITLRLESDTDGAVERYRLTVTPSAVTISAPTHAGLFYGLQTLRQLLPASPADASSDWSIPAVEIIDQPRFTYRGMHLDVGRHFFPVEFIKRYIDLMASYKMNTFHWHLTEDQGWRIEIRQYPRLTEVGSCRKETILERNFDPYVGDGIPYCGYYTQDEIRDVVAYAQSRYITVIPEIEMPGHSVAALAAYPEYACTDGPFEVSTVWGVKEDIYCPTEETFAFLEDVLTEVMELFPGTYIHIGGDEAPKTRWEESEIAQEVIRREGLADEHELQSYFIRRIERFLLANGRRLIGWDEILEGGLAPEATVMSWRGMDGGIEAAKQGHDVIMTPTSHMYFDYYQGDAEHEPLAIGGFTDLRKVYGFEPVPSELSSDEARHVLGAQGNVWTEYMKTAEHVEYMVFPRMLALAEVVWSPTDARDWDSFVRRLPPQLHWLDALDVNYRIPPVTGLERDLLTLEEQVTVELATLLPQGEIRYTLDGSDPTPASALFTGPIELPVTSDGVVVTARLFLPNGRVSPPRSARAAKTTLRPAASIDAAALSSGLAYTYFEFNGAVRSVERLAELPATDHGVAQDIEIPVVPREEQFGLALTGYLHVSADGIYTFHLLSDDGSRLLIGDEVVVDHDGLHGPTERSGTIALSHGYHPIRVLYIQAGGGRALTVAFEREGASDRTPVVARLYHVP